LGRPAFSISRERFHGNGFRSQHIGLANARFAKSPKTRHLAEEQKTARSSSAFVPATTPH
jgi:hypothetical protein